MPITVECSNQDCKQLFSVPDKKAGGTVECPVCKTESEVGSGKSARAAASTVRKMGDYEIVRLLGEGGMGIVYEAIQQGLQRRVALKVLGERFTKDTTFLERFRREARAAAVLNHPNIVQVFEIGEHEGTHFFSMEFAEGEDLHEKLRRTGSLPLAQALDIVKQTAAALQYAHEEHHIIHRDVKPDNILLTDSGKVKLVDLGLARKTDTNTRFTQTNAGMGTPHYMAPEQTQDAHYVDHRADIYSLGITLFHLVTGRLPFDGDSAFSIAVAHHSKPLPSAIEFGVDLPDEIDAVLRKMCAKVPAERYDDYGSLIEDLARVVAGTPTLAAENPPSLTANVMPHQWAENVDTDVVATGTVWPGKTAPPTSETIWPSATPTPATNAPSPSATTIPQHPIAAAVQSRWGALAVGVLGGCLVYGLLLIVRSPESNPTPKPEITVEQSTPGGPVVPRQEPLAGIAQLLSPVEMKSPEPVPESTSGSVRALPSYGTQFQQSTDVALTSLYQQTMDFVKANPDQLKEVVARLNALARRSRSTLYETPALRLQLEYTKKLDQAADAEFTRRLAESTKLEEADQLSQVPELWSKFPTGLLTDKIRNRIQSLFSEKGLPAPGFQDISPAPTP